MSILVDPERAVRVTIHEWHEWGEQNPGYGPDVSDDFYEVGLLSTIPSLEDVSEDDMAENGLPSVSDITLSDCYDDDGEIVDGLWYEYFGSVVSDVQYCIDQANDMVAGVGDYAEYDPQPDVEVDVEELDRALFPKFNADDPRITRWW